MNKQSEYQKRSDEKRGKVAFTMKVPDELRDRVNDYCDKHGMTKAAFLDHALYLMEKQNGTGS